ncbi:hypothetical protein NMS00_002429 [Vibrio alginolyticus]|uniref:hypothetical protein n=1 Tax=Vibrio TaxID=662 RepID=UPI0011206571|nr:MULTISPECIES: hypothetical protein [Vibrio]EJL6725127.1 hypothetical protein [Vibrio alginolyticus]MBE4118678.1 hypothetical protein [Vibrio parahaemolyticus]MBE5148011.1 hypothetical protein [Vibrio parahaemolyticus]MDW1890378.1 hypothetical protein [Vibrio sp. Vb1574]TOE60709.1 hypothetical protein CGJ39_20780 [Vibrio parahaemolyticus]
MDNKILTEFHEKIDKDVGLQSKRRSLIVASSILIAIYWTGATIKEFNGLIAKIEVKNTAAVHYLLVATIIYLMFRYFAYARQYHEQLRQFWVDRFLGDKKVFHYHIDERNTDDENIEGLIGKAIDVWVGDEPSLASPSYHTHSFFRRKIGYVTERTAHSGHPDDPDSREIVEVLETISLADFRDEWKLKDYLKLLSIEFYYRINSYTHYREYFDLMGPYIFGILAITPYLIFPCATYIFDYSSEVNNTIKEMYFSRPVMAAK